MPRWAALVVLASPLPVLAADRSPAPLSAERAAKTAVLPDGFTMRVFAAEPDVTQPISFTIDAKGRLWVAEATNYGEWKPTGKDRVIILEERDGKRKRTLFYEGFNYITGIEVGFGGVYVMSPPCLYFVPDRNGDDTPDGPPEVLFDGFGYKESRHNLANGFTWGPDGWLYGGHGRTSPSNVGRPGTPANRRIHCDGGVYRIHPTRLVFENFADGTTNPWGVDFDDFGACFVSNCVNPHLFHMLQGGHYEPWRNRPSSLYAYERLPTIADHLHYAGADHRASIGKSNTLTLGGGHAHCGTLIYLGDSFPKSFRNSVFMCNIHGRRINNDILKRKGSGYVASHGKDFMISADPWFMGVTLRTGPDGSVFVSDWSDTGECHTYKPDRATGRIYKISHSPENAKAIDLNRLTDAALVKLQLHPNDYFVRHARRILQERTVSRKEKANTLLHTSLRALLNSQQETPKQLRVLWALHVVGGTNAAILKELLANRSEHLRAWAIQLLCERETPSDSALEAFAKLAKGDPSPVVRLSLASALQRLPLAKRWHIAAGLVSHAEDAADANLPLMLWYGIEPLVPANPCSALQLASLSRIPLVRQFLARRATEDAIAKGEKGDLSALIALLATSDTERQTDLLQGMRTGLRGRKSFPMPEGWSAVYARLSKSDSATVRESATVLALTFGDPQALTALRERIGNVKAKPAERVAAIEALVARRVPGLESLLFAQLSDKATRRAAIRGLSAYSHPDTPDKLLGEYATFTAEEKADAVATLAVRTSYAMALLDAVERKRVPRRDVSAFAARQMFALGHDELSQKIRRVWGEVRETAADKQKRMAQFKARLSPSSMKLANVARGRTVFVRTCQQCHKLFGEGGTIGPDLTGTNRENLDYLLSNVIDPSAEVGRDFRMSTVRTTDARVVTGIVLERSAARLVIQTATDKVTLATEDVESVKDSPLSIMPEGQLDKLSREEVRDLFAYLASKWQVPLPK